MGDGEGELQQLEAYHRDLALQPQAGQVGMLRSGFLPSTPEVLVEAGIRCIPLVESEDRELSEAAFDRLEGILLKLKLSPSAQSTRAAVEALEERLRYHRQEAARDTRMGLSLLAGLAALLAALALYLVYRFTR